MIDKVLRYSIITLSVISFIGFTLKGMFIPFLLLPGIFAWYGD